MATQAHTFDLDKKFFDFLFPIAYPNVSNEIKNFVENQMLHDGTIAIETLLEQAISIEGNLVRQSINGQDFTDGSDAKRTTVRTRNRGQSYSANVSSVHAKVGKLRVMCYERKLDKFYYFVIPQSAFSHIQSTSNIEIPFDSNTYLPRRRPARPVIKNWWNYEVKDFHDMSTL